MKEEDKWRILRFLRNRTNKGRIGDIVWRHDPHGNGYKAFKVTLQPGQTLTVIADKKGPHSYWISFTENRIFSHTFNMPGGVFCFRPVGWDCRHQGKSFTNQILSPVDVFVYGKSSRYVDENRDYMKPRIFVETNYHSEVRWDSGHNFGTAQAVITRIEIQRVILNPIPNLTS